jgi:AraC-like DNA-binding protein
MHETLRGVDADGLERSCTNSIRFGAATAGIEFAEAHLTTCAFEPHRHDTYAIGITLAGVQTFRYRGERRVALPGQVHVLHPDETHDGAAGTEAGFGYRIVYVDPALVCSALGDRALPFVADPVQPFTRVVASLLADIDEPISDLRRAEIAASIEHGESLARAAADAGFADQSHMTRQFKRTYGLTPARWAKTVARD